MNKLQCKLCEFSSRNLVSHIKHKHNISPKEYKTKYNVNSLILYSAKSIKLMSESQKKYGNSDIGKLQKRKSAINGGSILTIKYWIEKFNLSESEAIQKIKQLQIKNAENSKKKWNPKNSILKKEYWKARYGLSNTDAKLKISEIQRKNSNKSSKYKGKKSSDERNNKISNSLKTHIKEIGTKKWISHFGKFNGSSKIEREFFNELLYITKLELCANVYIDGYVVDVLYKNKVIEFYGDYWHGNPIKYSSGDMIKYPSSTKIVNDIWNKDLKKIENLSKSGYDVLVIWENDWKKNKSECIEKIKKYYEIIS